jgi:hypothetical protein
MNQNNQGKKLWCYSAVYLNPHYSNFFKNKQKQGKNTLSIDFSQEKAWLDNELK